MSLQYGLNGNDLNWDFLDTVNWECTICSGDMDCTNHVHKYSEKGWAVYYDSNDGFARVVGHVPYEAYATDYLYELLESDETSKYQKSRIRKELKRRGKL